MTENSISQKSRKNKKRGIVGIESAIVLIAFVIVAAALSFVVLNMGFNTTQKAKETIGNTLNEAGVAMSVEGTITATGDTTESNLDNLSVPIKVTAGSRSINVQNETMTVSYFGSGGVNIALQNVYTGPITGTHDNLAAAQTAASSQCAAAPTTTCAYIYWTKHVNTENEILDSGEHAILVLNLASADQPQHLDSIIVEFNNPTGAVLTVPRLVPVITATVVNLQ